MAIATTQNQYLYTGKGPLDAKSIVKTYADLVSLDTWQTHDGVFTAYNGMIVAVWLNNVDTTKNGIYFLHDKSVSTARVKPDVTKEANWHKLAEIADITEKLTAIDDRLTALEEAESDVITYGYRSGFPAEGEVNKLYIAADEEKTYIWFDGRYLAVGGSSGSYEEPEIIYGGSAN